MTLLVLAAVGLLAGGWYIREQGLAENIVPSKLEPTESVVIADVPAPTSPSDAGTLQIAYESTWLPLIPQVTRSAAELICGLVPGTTCLWGGESVEPKQVSENTITISYPSSKAQLLYSSSTPIRFVDTEPGASYRVYFAHVNLLEETDQIHEAHIVGESGTSEKTLLWDGNEMTSDPSGNVQVKKLRKGHYQLIVVNTETGARKSVTPYINIIESDADRDGKENSQSLKAYAVGTPLFNSFWDGRGVFFDGKASADTVGLTFKKSEIEVYRGVDRPDLDQRNTLVFFRRPDNVVIVTTNVELFNFEDQSLTIEDLMTEVKAGK